MDYINLPPGLERRLAYSYYIRTNRQNNRMFRINERTRYERYERTRYERHNWDRLYFESIRNNNERNNIEYERNNEHDTELDDTLDNNLDELTNELANLIIEDEQFEPFDTESLNGSLNASLNESLQESVRESLPDLESDTEIDEIVVRGNRLLNSPVNFPSEPPGLEHFRGQFNYTEHHEHFTNLIDIEKGVISKNLIEKSKVIFFGGRGLPQPRTSTTQQETEIVSSVVGGLDPICSICRDNFEYIDITRQLICEHIFHINCIDTWFTKNKTCPECRYEI
jgi:hypothetical protein